jgi:UDP-GlcNAc:undecaprenyl-phosphate GlcNAc-1-phosphate transferase
MIKAAFVFVLGVAVVLGLTPWLIRWCSSGRGLDHPQEPRKSHLHPTPRTGGIALYLAFLSALAFVFFFLDADFDGNWAAVLAAGSIMFGLGIWDDFRPLGAKVKLAGQIAAALTAWFMGLSIETLSYPTGDFSIPLGGWAVVVTVLWLIAIPNMINLTDGIDGLASGVALFLFLTLGLVAWEARQFEILWISFGMAGALLGFLCFNFPPARIFLGDGGAYFIGFLIACLSLQSSNKGSIAAALFVIVLALGLPIMDTLFAILRRAFRGLPLFRADAEHIHHRLEHLGISKRQIVLGMYLLSATLSLVGLSILWSKGRTLPAAIAVFFVLGLLGARYLGYVGSWRNLGNQIKLSFFRRRDYRYALLQAQILELEMDRCGSAGAFRRTFLDGIQRTGFRLVPDDSTHAIDIVITRGHILQFYAPCAPDEIRHWTRIAECFHRPALLAWQRWPDIRLQYSQS